MSDAVATFESLLGKTLLEKKGTEVTTKSVVEGKDFVAIYHSAHWCPPCRRFTPQFIKAYNEIKAKGGKSLATVFVTCDRSQSAFDDYFGEMPWHAVPFSAKEFASFGGKSAKALEVQGIPHLAVYDSTGKLVTKKAVGLVSEMGSDFLKALDPEEKKKMDAESMEKLFAVMDINGDGFVDPSEIKDCLSAVQAPPHIITQETQTLMTRDADGDGKLSKKEFCVATYEIHGRSAKWLATAVTESLAEKKRKEEAKKEFEKVKGKGMEFFKVLLGDKVMSKSKGEVDIASALEGKEYVGVYMSAHWCGPCRNFTPQLAEAYAMIESVDAKKLGVVFVSADRSENDFKEYYGTMPWNAVPFANKDFVGFESKAGTYLDCQGIPQFAIFDAKGIMLNPNACGLVRSHGKDFLSKL